MRDRYQYPDDLFDNTRMTFGEHIEELRFYLIRAGIGFGICLIIGFVLDGLGTLGLPLGLGKPVLEQIKQPVEEQVQAFYKQRLEKAIAPLEEGTLPEDSPLRNKVPLKAELQLESLRPFLKEDADLPAAVPVQLDIIPAELFKLTFQGQDDLGMLRSLTTLSVQEGFVVYFKVSLLCGVVLSSPWLFMQVWGFVGAGLYPHERRYIQTYLPFSIGLFLGGVFMCQFIVLPRAVGALLAFNQWLGLDPDIRLNEWLGFAIILPLVFGISFQTPIFMLFFERIGIFRVEDYKKRWRIAVICLAAASAIFTPTSDAVSMSFLFAPMMALYLLGIWLCTVLPRPEVEELVDDDEVAV